MYTYSFEKLKVWQKAREFVSFVYEITKNFPRDEKYSLTSQVIRSSRSVPANIREGFAKRKYKQVFLRHLIDAIGSAEETKTWLDFALDCNYSSKSEHERLQAKYSEITAMLYSLINNWKNFEEKREEK